MAFLSTNSGKEIPTEARSEQSREQLRLLFDEIKLLFDDGLRHCLDTAEDKNRQNVNLAETSEHGVSVVVVEAPFLLSPGLGNQSLLKNSA